MLVANAGCDHIIDWLDERSLPGDEIATEERADVFAYPDPEKNVAPIFSLADGEHVKLIGVSEKKEYPWWKIKTADGRVGYTKGLLFHRIESSAKAEW